MFKTIAEYIQAVLWQGWWPLVGAVLTMVEIARRSLPPRLELTKALKWTPKRWLVVTLGCLGVAQFLAFRDLSIDSEARRVELQTKIDSRDVLVNEGKITVATLTGSKGTLESQLAQRTQEVADLNSKLADSRAARPLELKAPPGGIAIHADAPAKDPIKCWEYGTEIPPDPAVQGAKRGELAVLFCNQITLAPYRVTVKFNKPVITSGAYQYGLSGEIGSSGFSPDRLTYEHNVSSANLPAYTPVFITTYSVNYSRVVSGIVSGAH